MIKGSIFGSNNLQNQHWLMVFFRGGGECITKQCAAFFFFYRNFETVANKLQIMGHLIYLFYTEKYGPFNSYYTELETTNDNLQIPELMQASILI